MSNNFKVAYLISALDKSGPVNILFSVLSNLKDYHNNFIIITLKEIPASKSREQDFSNLGIQIFHVALGNCNFFSGFSQIKKKLKENHVSIVHSHCFRSCICNALLSLDRGLVTVHTTHSDPFYVYKFLVRFPLNYILMSVALFSFTFMTRLVACASYIEKKLKPFMRAGRLCSITNGVNTSFFCPLSNNERNKLISQLEWDPNKIHLVSSSRITRQKNYSYIIDALAPFKDKIHFIAIGDGDLFEYYKQFNQKGFIEFRGFCDDVRPYLQSADYFISSSKLEGFSCSVLEAMACGTPVLLSSIPSHIMLKEDKEYASSATAFFSLDNPSELSAVLSKIIDNPSLLNRECTRKMVCAHYSSQLMSQSYLDLYNSFSQ